MPPISVLLPTFNCAATVRDALESVKWADEILVVDSGSSDETLAICRQYGARILGHEYINSATQKNWATPQCRNEWILQIDSDEALEVGAREEVERAVEAAPRNVHAFRLERRNRILNRWMRYGGFSPDYQTRLFRRDEGRWKDREVHSHLMVPGEVRTLERCILHDDAPCIAKLLRKLDRYTRYEADELRKQGRHFRWHDLVLRPWGAFFYRYLWLQGFRDGWRGLIVCAYLAVYVFLTSAKLWEIEEMGLERSPQ